MTGSGEMKGKTVFIIDGFVNAGGTLIKATNICKKNEADKIICVFVSPVLANNALDKMKETGAEFIATNTIDSPVSKINIIPKIVDYVTRL